MRVINRHYEFYIWKLERNEIYIRLLCKTLLKLLIFYITNVIYFIFIIIKRSLFGQHKLDKHHKLETSTFYVSVVPPTIILHIYGSKIDIHTYHLQLRGWGDVNLILYFPEYATYYYYSEISFVIKDYLEIVYIGNI